MSLNFLTNFAEKFASQRRYHSATDVFEDPYLTATQKKIVLEAMLHEIKDEIECAGCSNYKQSRAIDRITKVKQMLCPERHN